MRETVRALADDKIAPHAAEVDGPASSPRMPMTPWSRTASRPSTSPRSTGSLGRRVATGIVIEEVARACASSSLIPAVNKLGTMPLLLAASEDVKQRFLPPVASGDAMFSYALSEPEAGSDAAAMKTRAVRDGTATC